MTQKDDIEKLRRIARLMDSQFAIPGTGFRFGFDGLLGLIPGVGDTVTAISTAYFVGMADQLGVPGHIKFKMILNGFIDWLVGLIPFIGDLFDFGFKANSKNARLILDYLKENGDIIEGEVLEREDIGA